MIEIDFLPIIIQEENRQKNEQIEAYIAQNNYLNEEILELHGRRKCEATTAMTSSVRRCSEQSDISLVESFIEEVLFIYSEAYPNSFPRLTISTKLETNLFS